MFEKVLLRNAGVPGSERIDVYLSRGGYQALPNALTHTPAELIATPSPPAAPGGRRS